ncbi:MAG: PhoU domain-containing protein [Halodesulfurarchaeum sp.]
MERRKVQVTGGSTYTVSIPKDWARENHVEAGDEIGFHPDSGSLLLTPITDADPRAGSLDISDLEGESLVRAVMTMYVSGFDVIELTAERITSAQRSLVRDATQGLVGLEVVEETGGTVLIRDLLDSSELSIQSAVRRMRLIALSMLEDAVVAVRENDDEVAEDVIERDDDVDRLWYVVSRIFRRTLRSPAMAQEIGISREDCFDFHTSARQLERIADHAVKISRVAIELDGGIPEPVVDSISSLHEESAEAIATAMDAIFESDAEDATRLANTVRETVTDIDGRARAIDDYLRQLEPEQARHVGLIVDSLSRSGDYGGNIAEAALQNAAPTPSP